MKIALIGNVCNNMYNIGMALRKHTDIIPHLYLENKTDLLTNPLNNDPDAINQSEWVFQHPSWDPTRVFKKFDLRFVRQLRKENYDAIIVSDAGVWLAPFIKKAKFCFWTTGADITRMPFPFAFNFQHKGLKEKLKAYYMAILQRWGTRHVDYFMTQPFMPFQHALAKLKVDPKKITDLYFPIIIDLDIFKYDDSLRDKMTDENLSKLDKFKFKIFHPSRLMLSYNKVLHNAGQWKGNEMLLKGLRAFIDKYQKSDVCIVLPDRKQTDRDLFEKHIEELNLQENVLWVKGRFAEGFIKEEMIALYSVSDLIVDEFGVGWFGSVVVEGAACKKPVMCYVDENVMNKLYPWHPVISVNTPETIAEEIAKLYFDKAYAEEKGNESRRWAEEFHSQEKAGKVYAMQIKKLLAEEK